MIKIEHTDGDGVVELCEATLTTVCEDEEEWDVEYHGQPDPREHVAERYEWTTADGMTYAACRVCIDVDEYLRVAEAWMSCELCGEPIRLDRNENYAEEVGEFWVEERETSVIAHAQCGLDRGLPLA